MAVKVVEMHLRARERWADVTKEADPNLANQEWFKSQLFGVLNVLHLACSKLFSCEVLYTPENLDKCN